jgi:hypothetical protein
MGHGSARNAATRSAAAKASARTSSDAELVVLAYAAGQEVPLDETERNGAMRRALFVFAAGGDLHRDPALDDPAVISLAADIDTPERRAALQAALQRVEFTDRMRNDPELAWRAFACSLLAEALGED